MKECIKKKKMIPKNQKQMKINLSLSNLWHTIQRFQMILKDRELCLYNLQCILKTTTEILSQLVYLVMIIILMSNVYKFQDNLSVIMLRTKFFTVIKEIEI